MPNVLRIRRRLANGSAGAPSLTGGNPLRNAELAFNEVNNTLYIGKGGDSTGVNAAGEVVTIAGDGVVWTGSQTFGTVNATNTLTVGNEAYAYKNSAPQPKLLATTDYVENLIGQGAGTTLFPLGVDADCATTGPVVTPVPSSGLDNFTSVTYAYKYGSSQPVWEPTGAVVLNGTTLANNQTVLVLSHAKPEYKGIWTVNTSGPWTRRAEATNVQWFAKGKRIQVTNGTANTTSNTYVGPSFWEVSPNGARPTNDFPTTFASMEFNSVSALISAPNIKYKRIVRAAGSAFTIRDNRIVIDGVTLETGDRFIWTPTSTSGLYGGATATGSGGVSADFGSGGTPLREAGIYTVRYDQNLTWLAPPGGYNGYTTNARVYFRRSNDFGGDPAASFIGSDNATVRAAHNTKIYVREGTLNGGKIFNVATGATFDLATDVMTFTDTFDTLNTSPIGLAGLPVIDGYQTVSEQRSGNSSTGAITAYGSTVLVKDETNPVNNGLYYIPWSANPASVIWERHPFMDAAGEVVNGTFIRVVNGNSNKNIGFVQYAEAPSNADSLIPGTHPLLFTSAQAALEIRAGVGLEKTNNIISAVSANVARISVSQAGIDLAQVPSVETNAASLNDAYILTHVDAYGRVTADSVGAVSSADFAAHITDATGTGSLVLATNPSLNGATIAATYGLNFSTDNNITAGTNNQGQAALTNDVNIVLTATHAPSAVTLPAPTAGRRVIVVNASSSNTVNVYPASTHQIDSLGTNSPLALIPGTQAEFIGRDNSQWYSVAGGSGGSSASGLSYTSTAVSGTTVTLSTSSTYRQRFTGTGTQIVNLPTRVSVGLGRSFEIANAATGNITVNTSSGTGNLVATVPPNRIVRVTVNSVAGAETTTSAWTVEFVGGVTSTGDNGQIVYAGSPTLTGTPLSTTAAADTNTTQIATTAYVVGQASSSNPVMDGTVAVGTSLKYARADHVHPTDTSRAPLASPALTGAPTAPTAAADTNTTQIATTAYVVGQASSSNPVMDGTVAVGTSLRYARADHVHPTDTSRAPTASPTFTGTVTANDLTVNGNLTVGGTTTTVNTATMTVVDPIISIGGTTGGAAPSSDDSKDRGTAFQWHNGTAARVGFFGWDRSTQRFAFIPEATISNEIVSGTLGTIDVGSVFINGSQISAANLSNSTTGTAGTSIVLATSPALAGTPTAPTAAADTNTTQIATTAYVIGQGYLKSATASSTYAPLASPALTGTPTATTAAADTNTTQIATTAYVVGQASSSNPVMDGTVAVGTSLRYARADHVHPTDTSRAPLASPALTGTPTAPTAAADTNTTQIATTAYVIGQSYLKTTTASSTYAPLASPALTGTPTATTAAADTNTTQIATTAYVVGQASSSNPVMDGSVAVGTSLKYARADHVHPTDTSRAPLASPALTGTPTAPTAAVDTNTTQIATTAYVMGQGYVKSATLSSTYATVASPTFTGLVTIPNVKFGYTTTATAAGTTTLANTSDYYQFFTGTTTQTVVLPVASTMQLGQAFEIHNNSTGTVTVNSSGANLVATVESGKTIRVVCVLTSGTTAASWDVNFDGGSTSTGSGATVYATSPAFAGTPTAPTAAADTNTTQIATTAYVIGQGYLKSATASSTYAPLASPALTGTPTATTAAADTNTTQIATTAYVVGQASSSNPVMDGSVAVGTSLKYARADHVHPTDTSRAPLASPALTGTPTAPTAAADTNTTQIATTAYVIGQSYLKTTTASSTYAPLASPALTGTPTATTAAADTNTTQIATTAYVVGQASASNPVMDGSVAVGTSLRYARADHVHPTDTSRAPLASPGLTGTPTAPTAAADTNTTQLATTAYVVGQASSSNPVMDGTVAVGTSLKYARADHVHPTDTSRAPTASPTFTGTVTANDLTVNGNLTVGGTTTTVNTATMTVVDPIITIGGVSGGGAPTTDDSKDRGTAFQWHNGTAAKVGFFGWDRSTQRFAFIPDATISGEIVSGTLGNIDVGSVFINGSQISAANLSNGTTGTAGSNIVLATSPTLAGTPLSTTAAADTNTTQIATTAFVVGQASSTTPAMDSTGAVGTSLKYARADHVHPTDTSRAPLASPTFTGTPAAPTAAVDTNTTQLATTAYVIGQGYLKSATASSTYFSLSGNNAVTGASTFTNVTGQTFRYGTSNDQIVIRGRNGGSTDAKVILTTAALTASTTRTLTIPDEDGTIVTNASICSAVSNCTLDGGTF